MNKHQKEYINRINRVIDYIYQNLDRDLSLSTLADIALFSPYHFHRIFSAFVGETLNDFVKRIRLEKAARLLIYDEELPITEVAELSGYNNLSAFCRSFKKQFSTSAQDYRLTRLEENSKMSTNDSKKRLSFDFKSNYVCSIEIKLSKTMKTKIEIKKMPALELLCCKHVGAFDQIGEAYGKLMQWAGPRGLLSSPDLKTVTVYHDDPNVTDMNKVRQSACITTDGSIKPEGEISTLTVEAGLYAVGRFEVDASGFKQAWDSMCMGVAESGYQPQDAAPYELYHNDHEEHPERKFIVDICIPVKAM